MKKFVCQNFVTVPCAYVNTGNEDEVVNQATDHVVKEHGYEDTPQLREDIRASLVDA